MKTNLVILIIAFAVVVVVGGVYVYTVKSPAPGEENPPTICVKEGEMFGRPVSMDTLSCCPGLKAIYHIEENNSVCGQAATDVSICANCGNDVCGLGENKCNCPADCGVVPNLPTCVDEGEQGGTMASVVEKRKLKNCCSGLSKLPIVAAGADLDTLFVCGKCGNGVCGWGENYENCVQDCGAGSAMEQNLKQLVKTKWGDCTNKCKNFSVSVNYNADIPSVVATYDGMYDNSIKVEIIRASLMSKPDSFGKQEWVIDESVIDKVWACWPNRGHQTYSQEPCI